jgi:predicted PurR-regulated permease PerM
MSLPLRRVDLPFATFAKAVAVIALVWAWLAIWRWVLIALIAVFLAIALEPAVTWLSRRGLKRGLAAPLVMVLLVAAFGGFIVAAGASLPEQARTVGDRLSAVYGTAMAQAPEALRGWLESSEISDEQITKLGGALAAGLAGLAVAIVMAVYFLIEGRRTYLWLAAFAPPSGRPKVHQAAAEARHVIAAYVRGNLITSALATVATFVFLTALDVPAALFLALIAGVFNLLPVVGILLSAVPAVLLGLTVSTGTGIAVAVFFLSYNAIENYYIQPKVYGRELELSDIAVIAAFLVGAELGGVLGAMVALPIAAIYPAVERIWLSDSRRADLPDAHARIETECAAD